ncbi:MAG: methyltransferase domain-containing protein [Candidatus Heimdallarchaeota archaeon]|nr:methyltransferase domain-containing protein [Candidatus Heimdallarchaeota archaeon]
MSKLLRDAYSDISDDYLRKKSKIWEVFLKFYHDYPLINNGIVLDVGAANGRNLLAVDCKFSIALDLSIDLLRGFIGPPETARIGGVLPNLPFRNKSIDGILSIAVIHHLINHQLRSEAISDMNRVCSTGEMIISVWRLWRRGVREKIYEKIREGKSIDALIDEQRPWKSGSGEVLATRFYHYFTFKELSELMQKEGLIIKNYAFTGGKYNDANIFVKTALNEI